MVGVLGMALVAMATPHPGATAVASELDLLALPAELPTGLTITEDGDGRPEVHVAVYPELNAALTAELDALAPRIEALVRLPFLHVPEASAVSFELLPDVDRHTIGLYSPAFQRILVAFDRPIGPEGRVLQPTPAAVALGREWLCPILSHELAHALQHQWDLDVERESWAEWVAWRTCDQRPPVLDSLLRFGGADDPYVRAVPLFDTVFRVRGHAFVAAKHPPVEVDGLVEGFGLPGWTFDDLLEDVYGPGEATVAPAPPAFVGRDLGLHVDDLGLGSFTTWSGARGEVEVLVLRHGAARPRDFGVGVEAVREDDGVEVVVRNRPALVRVRAPGPMGPARRLALRVHERVRLLELVSAVPDATVEARIRDHYPDAVELDPTAWRTARDGLLPFDCGFVERHAVARERLSIATNDWFEQRLADCADR